MNSQQQLLNVLLKQPAVSQNRDTLMYDYDKHNTSKHAATHTKYDIFGRNTAKLFKLTIKFKRLLHCDFQKNQTWKQFSYKVEKEEMGSRRPLLLSKKTHDSFQETARAVLTLNPLNSCKSS